MGSSLGTEYQIIQTKTADYTALPSDDVILVDATSGNVIITLYGAAESFRTNPYSSQIAVVKTDAGANTVTIVAKAGDAIYAPSLVLSAQYQNLACQSDGSDTWFGFGGSLASVWGAISGTLANQTDLVAALALKSNAANPTFTGIVKAPLFANGFRTQATAAGTTTLTAADVQTQAFTGVTTQIVALPVTSTLSTGFFFKIINNSTGAVTVNSSGGNAVVVLAAGARATVECILITGTDAASWAVTTPSVISAATGTSLALTAGMTSASPTAGIGYATGSGGAQTQATDKTTTVASNTITTAITMNAAQLNAATIVAFTFTNTAIAATDTVICTHQSGGTSGAYTINAFPGAGSAVISVRNNSAGNLSEAVVIRVTVIKSVSA